MSDERLSREVLLECARSLTERLEAEDDAGAEQVLEELARVRESDLFRQVGQLTRDLHEALKSFQLDPQVFDLAEREIPDAKERLRYVVTLTEQAAHRTLNAVEASMPVAERLGEEAGDLHGRWGRFRRRELSVEEFRALSREVEAFLGGVVAGTEGVRAHLSEVLMAQDFQDLTGQVIRRVIDLVQEVEENLVTLMRVSGGRRAVEEQAAPAAVASGPAVPGVAGADVVCGQDEVDALLSDLGF